MGYCSNLSICGYCGRSACEHAASQPHGLHDNDTNCPAYEPSVIFQCESCGNSSYDHAPEAPHIIAGICDGFETTIAAFTPGGGSFGGGGASGGW